MSDRLMDSGNDPLGAFMPGPRLTLPPSGMGPLNGLSFGAKDIFDVAGHVTGCGNPDWARTHMPAPAHAPAVEKVLAAGANLVGKTITDELAYSLNGQNHHYGTPTNSNAPGRIPGGSSCGSASAVAGGACDFALGSDTGGSVRIPGSYCGVYGLRPTHGRVDIAGVMPLAPSFDTVGWFARELDVLTAVGEVLLGEDKQRFEFKRVLAIADVTALASEAAQAAVAPLIEAAGQRVAERGEIDLVGPEGFGSVMWHFRLLQGQEIWRVHSAWIEGVNPSFGPEITERFEWVRSIKDDDDADAQATRQHMTELLEELCRDDTLLCLPTAPDAAPKIGIAGDAQLQHRTRVLSMTCPSGFSGLPQVTLPLAQVGGCPLGLSFIGPRGSDRALLDFAAAFANQQTGGEER